MATYRQELRDLPKQDGFPSNVTFPVPPESDKRTEQMDNPIIIKEEK